MTLIGTLPAVGSLWLSFNSTTISLAWTAPSVNGIEPDVDGYCIDIVSATAFFSRTFGCELRGLQFHYPVPADSICNAYTFIVSANNMMGRGQGRNVSFTASGERTGKSYITLWI